ncbi:MAG: 30S ribosomal protein S16 [Phycisphaerae bacterium]|nr:30S ribosomal protein S16 [Phycisphaerae bacterium]
MAVKLRMTRMGRRHRPFFRINAIDSRTPRDGRILEKLGHYDPIEKDKAKQIVLDIERAQFWLDQGAIPSDTVSDILAKLGIKTKQGEQRAARRTRAVQIARKQGKPFTKTERLAAEKAAAEAKKAAEEKAKAEEEAKKKAEAEAKKQAEEAAKAAEAAKAEAPAEEKTE